MHTILGGFFTFLVNVVVLIYGTMKFVDLYTRDGPTVNDTKIDDHFPASEMINFNERNWRMAFTIENISDRFSITDPRYVKWLARLYVKQDKETS